MRIAVVHSFYSRRQPSGENTVVDHQAALLEQAGHDVRLFSADTDAESERPLYHIRSALRVSTGVGQSPARNVGRFRPDVIHVHNLFPNFGSAWLRTASAPIVTTVHNYRYFCAPGTFHRDGADCRLCPEHGSRHALVHRCYRGSFVATLPLAVATRGVGRRSPVLSSSAALVALNRSARDHFRRYAPDVPVEVVPNYVPRPTNSMSSTGASRARGYWLYAGRLAPVKGILELLDAWPAGEQLVIVGDGPLRGEVLRRVSTRSDLIYSGVVGPAELAALMASALGLVVPSVYGEGLPTVIPECLATGTPVLLSDRISWAAEVESDAVTTFDPVNGDSLAAALTNVRLRPETRRSAALELYGEHFSAAAWLEAITRLYDRVVAEAAAGSGRGTGSGAHSASSALRRSS